MCPEIIIQPEKSEFEGVIICCRSTGASLEKEPYPGMKHRAIHESGFLVSAENPDGKALSRYEVRTQKHRANRISDKTPPPDAAGESYS